MEGTISPLPQVIALKKKYKAYLFLDEAHSIGALGRTGRGVVEYCGCSPADVDIMMGTLTKSFAAAGGYIAGAKQLIDHLRVKSHDGVYGMAMSPPVVQQVISSMSIMMGKDGSDEGQRRIKQLIRNTHYFRKQLKKLGFLTYGHMDSPVVPCVMFYCTRSLHFIRETLNRNLATVGVCYPATPLAKCRARFCLSAGHTKEQLDWALNVCSQVADISNTKYGMQEAAEWRNVDIIY
uniref:serine C-palmitoyltransferase n=1 Tax=Plectus sambesii TaxID=2011161 RepID=A0A914XG10_9BILA